MGKYIELTRGAIAMIRSLIHPVYLIDDVPSNQKAKYLHIRANHKKKISQDTLTLLSWNILRNYNKDNIKDSLQELFFTHNPDIIFIQEAPVYDSSSYYEDELFQDFHLCYAPSHQVKQQSSFYNFKNAGQLILSRFPFTRYEVYPLPSITKPTLGKNHLLKRIALYAQLQSGTKMIGLYNLHLENIAGPEGRKKQLAYICSIIEQNQDDIVILGGDFNTLFSSYFESGLSFLEQQGFQNLFSAAEIRFPPRLDYFLVKNASAAGKQVSGKGSDHQPIIAILKL